MAKITIPTINVEKNGILEDLFYNKAMIRTNVIKSELNADSIAEGAIELSISEVGAILNGSGEVEQYLMSVYAPIALLDTDVPEDLPNNKTLDGAAQEVAKQFKDWFSPGAEIWKKDTDDFIIFYTNPFASNASSYLTGTEISIINDINGSVNIHTVAWAENEVVSGWTKI